MIQTIASPIADIIFKIITMLAQEIVLVPICACLYWCIDKEKGVYVIHSAITSLVFGNIIKDIFRIPRPIGQEGVRSIYTETATGYSMPSLHTQGITSTLTAFNILIVNTGFMIFSVVAVILVGISRIYLGVHYPKDVLAGMILGVIIPFVTCVIFEKVKNELLIISATVLIMSTGFFVSPSEDFYKTYGLCIGMLAGVFIEQKLVKFQMPRTVFNRNFRFFFGIALTVALYWIMGKFLPSTNLFYLLKYTALTTFAMGIYPMIFKKMKV